MAMFGNYAYDEYYDSEDEHGNVKAKRFEGNGKGKGKAQVVQVGATPAPTSASTSPAAIMAAEGEDGAIVVEDGSDTALGGNTPGQAAAAAAAAAAASTQAVPPAENEDTHPSPLVCAALLVVLGNDGGEDGKRLFDKKQLQLLSMEACTICRDAETISAGFKLLVTEMTPRWVWDRANFEPLPGNPSSSRKIRNNHKRKRGGRPRRAGRGREHGGDDGDGGPTSSLRPGVPPMRINHLAWARPLSDLGDGGQILMQHCDVTHLEFTVKREERFQMIGMWPPNVHTLMLGGRWDQDILGMTWPRRLGTLRLGWYYSRPLSGGIDWPAGLHTLYLGHDFDASLDDATWPPALKRLYLSDMFSKEIHQATFPETLEFLDMGVAYNAKFLGVEWPKSLVELKLSDKFNHTISPTNGLLPTNLKRLTLGLKFNVEPERFMRDLPETLEELTFGAGFTHSIAEYNDGPRMPWPRDLKRIELGPTYNESLAGVCWPKSLEEVVFGYKFGQAIGTMMVDWPTSMKRIVVGRSFDTNPGGHGFLSEVIKLYRQDVRGKWRRERVEAYPGDPGARRVAV